MADLNPGQFSQPHLPGFNIKPTAEHRYPRGYTPERLAEVTEALGGRRTPGSRTDPVPNESGRGMHAEHREGVESRNTRDIHYRNVSIQQGTGTGAFSGNFDPNKRGGFGGRNEGEAKIVETVARSTVPTERLADVNVTVEKPDESKDYGGLYKAGRREASVVAAPGTTPTAPLGAKQMAQMRDTRQHHEQVLMHELGHHESASLGLPHSGKEYERSAAAHGQEEAYADDFAVEHYRPDPRDERRGEFERSGYDRGGKTPINPYNKTDNVNKQLEFAESYRAHRQHPNEPAPHTYNMAPGQVGTYPSGMPKYQSDPDIEGQHRLFNRKGRVVEETTPDYGQHPLYMNEPTGEFYRSGHPKTVEVDLPTIKLGRGVPEKYRRG